MTRSVGTCSRAHRPPSIPLGPYIPSCLPHKRNQTRSARFTSYATAAVRNFGTSGGGESLRRAEQLEPRRGRARCKRLHGRLLPCVRLVVGFVGRHGLRNGLSDQLSLFGAAGGIWSL